PTSLRSEPALEQVPEQLPELSSEHSGQREGKECQQHGAEEHELSRSSEETVEDTELIVLDPEHPLMRRFQDALKNYLTNKMEKMNLELCELRTATQKGKAQREELGVILHGAQQQLAQLQAELGKSQDRQARMAEERRQLEEELQSLRADYDQMCHSTENERKRVSAMQTQVEQLALQLFSVQNMDQDMHHHILWMKQSAKRAEADKIQAEVEKKKQDLLLERLTRRAFELQEQIALLEAQLVAQAEDTKVTRQAVSEADLEIQAINMEKKRLMNHWNSSLAGMKQRDEAYVAIQELLSKYRCDLKSLEVDIHGCGKSIRKEEEKNELLVTILNRQQNDVNVTRKLIAQCLSQQEALKLKSGTYTRVLQETEKALSKTKMDQAAHLNELLSIRKDIEKGTEVKEKMENEIMAKLQDQMISSNAAKHFSQLAAKLRRKKTELQEHFSKVESDVLQAAMNATEASNRLTALNKTLCEVDKEVKNTHDLVISQENELKKCTVLAECKEVVINRCKKKLEMILAQQGGQELAPLEIEISKLTKEIEECNSEVMTLQKYWLREQKELVKLTQEREEQITSLDMLKKKITIMQQRKVRMESKSFPESSLECSSMNGGEREWNMSNDLIKLNRLINKNNSSFEELRHGNLVTENEFVHSLKAAEKEIMEMQEKHSQLTEEKERLVNSLIEAEHQIMLWEKKIQLAKEMRAAVDSEAGQGEIRAMKAEIHRMQVRYKQLLKQQEKMVQDMEASLLRREMIAIQEERRNKANKKRSPRDNFRNKRRELKRKILETKENIYECNQAILDLENTRESLNATFLEKQQELCRLQTEVDDLDWERECLRNEKRWNLLELVAYQTHQKQLQALREGRYRALCRTEQACRNQQDKLQDRLRSINTIIQRMQQEHPQHHRVLQWLSCRLGSRLGSQK
ncbi:Coiled-coil domain-containing protein 40, partial [Acanthisitta chloris]